jgi:hypothetical protein
MLLFVQRVGKGHGKGERHSMHIASFSAQALGLKRQDRGKSRGVGRGCLMMLCLISA